MPLQVPYCVAKAGTVTLYEGLRLEERRAKSGVEVTTILPVSVNTPFYDSAPSWLSKRPPAIPPVYHPSAVAKAIVFAAENPRRHIFVGAAAAQLAMLQWLSPALTDRLLTVADQIFVRQERDQADRGESNLYEPRPGQGATTGTSVRFTLRRSHWTRLVGFHPGAARAIGLVAATALGCRIAAPMMQQQGRARRRLPASRLIPRRTARRFVPHNDKRSTPRRT